MAGSDWSNWSAPYARSGDPIASPSPRQYLTLRARLTTTDPMHAASLHSIRLNFNPPVAKQLQGELDIGIFERLGAPQEVSLFVKPTFASQDLGFDEILVRTPPDMSLEFGALRLGSSAQWESGQAEELANVQVMETRSDSLWLRLDRVVKRGGRVDLVEVRFTTALFSPGVVLQASLGNSSLANSWQQVDPADVTELAQSQGLQILASVQDNKVLGDLGDPARGSDAQRRRSQRRANHWFYRASIEWRASRQSADLRPRRAVGAPPRYPKAPSGRGIRARLGGQ